MINYLDKIMVIEDALLFMIAFILFQVIQAIFINGVKIAASGTTEKLPDGTEKDSEMILYPFYKWLCQSYTRKVYYSGSELQNIWSFLTITMGNSFMIDFPAETVKIQLGKMDPFIQMEREGEAYIFYKEITEYKYSKYLRKPIIQCIICMASFWGFFTYWFPVYFLLGINFFTVSVWIINTICLSYTNYLVFKKL